MSNATGSNDHAGSGKPRPSDFIRDIVAADLASGKCREVVTRFPPEPNGYLHIGHAKSICLNFGIAVENGGRCNLRMDDTNPTREEAGYVEAIIRDVAWLVEGWADHCFKMKPRGAKPVVTERDGRRDYYMPPAENVPSAELANPRSAVVEPFYASDYFEALYDYALQLIRAGKAYVCDLSAEEMEEYRGTPEKPGRESPYRNRSVEENLDLFQRMRAGEFPDGARTLRAKIDMASPNIWMRDPVLYRIRHAAHHHAGDQWCIYPTYDFAHCLSDYIEGITHSICTLEFEVHRPLYDWILENLNLPRPLPHQYEFAKLIPSYTVVSKRKLVQLVNEGIVRGWDDPRLPTLAGLRRRGVPAQAIRDFAYHIGVTKYPSLTDIAVLEHTIRDDLNRRALRRLAVLRPVKLVITNLPEGHREEVEAVNNPEDPAAGTRRVTFTREVYIDDQDFMEEPPPKYHRLRPGGEVRLKYAYIVRCDEVIKGPDGRIKELRCTADLGSKRGGPTANRKVKGTIHWVSAADSIPAEVRLYDRLFTVPEPDADGADFRQFINPNSLEVVEARLESGLREARANEHYQFERLGYFYLDPDSTADRLVFNRTITLRDTWAKLQSRQQQR
ncbi:MAG: glutamine--tRNA ligase/YqeY domain fusion protein [Verrucomicrobia bacterium]|nr:MAG: glutamine--tRNA ligase/YqeY domain fusion protein [Verrucomicrobiota bacterium]